MSKEEFTDSQRVLIIKNAIEYNAGVMSIIATKYDDDMDNEKKQRLKDSLLKITKIYKEKLVEVLDGKDL